VDAPIAVLFGSGMKSKGLRIAFGIVGLLLLVLGLAGTIVEGIKSLHASAFSNAVTVSLGVSAVWPGLAVVGAILCVWSYLSARRRAGA
jgi:hypothetical protein